MPYNLESSSLAFPWRTIIATVDNKIFASVYYWLFILPILAKLTQDFPAEFSVRFGNNSAYLSFVLDLPFTWYLLYFSAVSLSISRIIYNVRCPTFLKNYTSAGDAIQKGITVQSIRNDTVDFVGKYFHGKANMKEQEFSSLRRIAEQYRIKPYGSDEISSPEDIPPKQFCQLLNDVEFREKPDLLGYYQVENPKNFGGSFSIERSQLLKHVYHDFDRFLEITYFKMRMVCSVSILLGFILLACVFLQSLCYVYSSIFTFHP